MPKRILVIDDNAPIPGLVRQFIEARPGFEVCGEAADGVEGVQKGQELNPDLIVLDFLMPRINGLQAALILHEFAPSTPIILFTFYKEAIPGIWLRPRASLRFCQKQINSVHLQMRSKDSQPHDRSGNRTLKRGK